MKKQILFLALLMIISIQSFSQIIFENGYFINDSDKKIECLVKNMDWKDNPTEFKYMLSQDTIAQNASIETVKEFGIIGVSKYIRKTVEIDRSSDEINDMTSERSPNFKEERLFLKVLIEGKASLFYYEDGNLNRFFYNLNDSEVKQLVYKRFKMGDKIAKNIYFKQQLFMDLKCQAILLNDVERLKYTNKDLEQFFIEYNECDGSDYIKYESTQKKDLFNLSFRPGLNYSNLAIRNDVTDYEDIDFDGKLSFRFGIEAEFIFPFNKNKWAVIIEPTYQYYKSDKTTETNNVPGGILVSEVNYQSIELPIGVRHYFFLNDKSKIFADISYRFDFSTKASINFMKNDGSTFSSLEVKSRKNLVFGMGYKYLDKYSLGIRYQSREILQNYVYWNSSYNTFSVIFGYSLF